MTSWLQPGNYWMARVALEKSIAALFLIAFVNVVNQFKPLLGQRGLLPVPLFVKEVGFKQSPSLFFFFPTYKAFTLSGWIGVTLSGAIMAGIFDGHSWLLLAIWATLWVLYLSFVNVGQIFYGFGWESILLEAGALAALPLAAFAGVLPASTLSRRSITLPAIVSSLSEGVNSENVTSTGSLLPRLYQLRVESL